jgi:hypothetical protein
LAASASARSLPPEDEAAAAACEGTSRLKADEAGASWRGVPIEPAPPPPVRGVDGCCGVVIAFWGEVDSAAVVGVGEARVRAGWKGSAHLTPTIHVPPSTSPLRPTARRASSSEWNVTVNQLPPDGSEKDEAIGPRAEKCETTAGWSAAGGPKMMTCVLAEGGLRDEAPDVGYV